MKRQLTTLLLFLSSSYCLIAMEGQQSQPTDINSCPFTKDIVSTYIWHCAGLKENINKIKWQNQIDIYGVSIRIEDTQQIKKKNPIISISTTVLLWKELFDNLTHLTIDSFNTLDPILKYRLIMAFKNNNKFESSDNKFLDAYTCHKFVIGPVYSKPTMLIGFETNISRKDFKKLLQLHHESL